MRFLILTLFLIVNIEAKSLFSNTVQADTSKYIDNLKNLIISTQKTRGLTNSYLNGNTVAMLLVYGTRDDMKESIGNMESFSIATDPIINNRATSISKALIELNQKAFKQEPAKSFADYTEQIGHILMLAQSVNKRFAKDVSPFAKESSEIMLNTMLPMTEFTGRLRGLGAGIAAKGTISKKNAQKIKALIYKLKHSQKNLEKKMQNVISNYGEALPYDINIEIAVINKKLNIYTSYAENYLLVIPSQVEPNQYFDQGTELIGTILKAYDTLNNAILHDSKGWI